MLFEDLNPSSLEHPWDLADPSTPTSYEDRIQQDQDSLGDAYNLIAAMAYAAYDGKFVFFVSTKYQRVADALQHINEGTKCMIAPSMVIRHHMRGTQRNIVNFDAGDRTSFGWTPENRFQFLKKMFPDASERKVRAVADNADLSIRECCEELSRGIYNSLQKRSSSSTVPFDEGARGMWRFFC